MKSPTMLMLLRALVHCISPLGKRKITALIYHRVALESSDFEHFSVKPDIFDWQMRLISKLFNVISIDEAVAFLDGGDLPPRAIVITFDDGYMDNFAHALPILKKYNLCATIYVAGDAIKTGRIWNQDVSYAILNTKKVQLCLPELGFPHLAVDSLGEKKIAIQQLKALFKKQKTEVRDQYLTYLLLEAESIPNTRYMMSEEQIKKLSDEDCITIGCHSMSHPMLSYTSTDTARIDISESLDYLRAITGKPVEHFAYPYGKYGVDFHAEHVNCVAKLPLKSAVTTDLGTIKDSSSFFMLRRFTPWNENILHFFIQLCKNYNR